MTAPSAAALVDFVLGLALPAAGQGADNRFTLEGLALAPGAEGTLDIRIRKLEAASLRLASGPLALELGRLVLHEVVARLQVAGSGPRLLALEAASAELADVKLQAPLSLSPPATGTMASGTDAVGAWCLAPLAELDGTLQAEIVDATLLFDADVRIPIRRGEIDFNATSVAHVGPDSRMGVSHLGVYVDAPNGRSYVYQFPSAPLAGVEYEKRSALPGPWGTKRGRLRLQPFAESLLRQGPVAPAQGLTAQARNLLGRTAVSGLLQPGNGRLAAPGLRAELVERDAGRNVVRLKSQAVGRGLDLDVAALSLRDVALDVGGLQLACDAVTGALEALLAVDGAQLRGELRIARLDVARPRLR